MRPVGKRVRIKDGTILYNEGTDIGGLTGESGFKVHAKDQWGIYLDDSSVLSKSYKDMMKYRGQETCLIYVQYKDIEWL